MNRIIQKLTAEHIIAIFAMILVGTLLITTMIIRGNQPTKDILDKYQQAIQKYDQATKKYDEINARYEELYKQLEEIKQKTAKTSATLDELETNNKALAIKFKESIKQFEEAAAKRNKD